MKYLPVIVLLSAILIMFSLASELNYADAVSSVELSQVVVSPPPPETPSEITQVEAAINTAVAAERKFVLALLASVIKIEGLSISNDGNWAIAWLVPVDPDTEEPIPIEPGLVIAERISGEWRVWLPTTDGWLEKIAEVPEDLLSKEHKETWIRRVRDKQVDLPTDPLGGYLLPWEIGKVVNLTQSTCHDSYITSGNAHYAFDFSIYGTLWEIYAAKAGEVWLWKDDVPTCYEYTCSDKQPLGNYLVIRDTTTDPVTYQLYLHLAQYSIPEELKAVGTPVAQGQFIGIVDNTGQSWGHHLHFQVQVPLYGDDYYWGKSVDITFDEVDINEGRPRVQNAWCDDKVYCTYPDDVCDDFRAEYISANVPATDLTPPEGDLLEPLNGTSINTRSLRLEGWATDEGSGLESAQFIARYNGVWHDVGPSFDSISFDYTWDLCADHVPDGPVSLALSLSDKKGNHTPNLPGLRHITKHYACDPIPPLPSCIPSKDQIALFAQPNYQGECQMFGTGDYAIGTTLEPVGEDNAASIMIGENVLTTLFTEANYEGRVETLDSSDPNLDDNATGSDTLSSMRVKFKSKPPNIPQPIYPQSGATYTETTSLSLIWNDGGKATHFQARLISPTGTVTTPWQHQSYWHLGSLPAGTYTWSVRGANAVTQSNWSQQTSLNVVEDYELPGEGYTAPYTDTLENSIVGWRASGLWNLWDQEADAHSGNHSWWYGQAGGGDYSTGTNLNHGDLTTPIITLPMTTTAYGLQFWYRYETESIHPHWDQRLIQVSVDGEPFTNVYQLYDDPSRAWLHAQVDLSDYLETQNFTQTIQVRFHFTTIDEIDNTHAGWFIDDVQISTRKLILCPIENEPNDTPEQAIELSYGTSIDASICPVSDYDYYTFQGFAGDRIVADVDAKIRGSSLDAILFLLDKDGSSVLAEHDDEILGIRQDPHLGYVLPRDGIYFLLLRAWDNPQGSGEYSLTLFKDHENPIVSITSPKSNTFLPGASIPIDVDTVDADSGIKSVKFWWHSGDWENDDWVELGTDLDGEDGWGMEFDASVLEEQERVALYAHAYDWADNWSSAGSWNLGIDHTPPDTSAEPLPDPSTSTAIHLRWTGTDNLSGIKNFDLRYRQNEEGWLEEVFESDVKDWWFIGESGNKYTFQIRAEDNAGNLENYNQSEEVTTTIPPMEILCSQPDTWESGAGDNSAERATELPDSISIQIHNFCNPISGLSDQDWFTFDVSIGQRYTITVLPLDESAAGTISLYAKDGQTILDEVIPTAFGQPTRLVWSSNENGVAYLKISHPDERVAGNDVSYQLILLKGHYSYFPMIFK